jgi:GxxExxY protein
LSLRGIPFQTKSELHIFYKDNLLATSYRPDLLVCDAIVVELKAVSEIVPDHDAQLFNYLRIARKQIGYLINFGKRDELEWKRFILSDLHRKQQAAMQVSPAISLH